MKKWTQANIELRYNSIYIIFYYIYIDKLTRAGKTNTNTKHENKTYAIVFSPFGSNIWFGIMNVHSGKRGP